MPSAHTPLAGQKRKIDWDDFFARLAEELQDDDTDTTIITPVDADGLPQREEGIIDLTIDSD